MGWIARCVMMNHDLWFSVHHAPTQSCTTLTIFSKILTYPLIFFIVLFASVLFPPNNKTVQWSRLLHVDKRRLRLQRRLRAVLEVSKQGTPCIYTERLQLQSHFLCRQYYINNLLIFQLLFSYSFWIWYDFNHPPRAGAATSLFSTYAGTHSSGTTKRATLERGFVR